MAGMTDAHRLIVQTFMSRGILAEKELEDVTKHACDHFSGKLLFFFSLTDFANIMRSDVSKVYTETASFKNFQVEITI